MGRPTVGASVGIATDISLGGLSVVASIALDVGDSVPVKFAGRPVMGARIVWKRGALVGLSMAVAEHRP